MTLDQLNALIDAAYEAINVNELSFAAGGKSFTFHNLDSLTRYIDWLTAKRDALAVAVEYEANPAGGHCPVVRFVEVDE